MQQKNPDTSNAQELATVFAYYLHHERGIQYIRPEHILACYNEVGVRKPTNLGQVLNNIKTRKGWLGLAPEKGSYILAIAGENFVEHDLPRAAKQAK